MPGFIPEYMKFIAHRKMSFFLGFDGDAEALSSQLDGDISPRLKLFEEIEKIPSCYLLFVDDQWWEGYSSIPLINAKLRMRLDGHKTDSDRWNGDGTAEFPEF